MPDVLVAREYDGKVEKGAQSQSVCVCVCSHVCVCVCVYNRCAYMYSVARVMDSS